MKNVLFIEIVLFSPEWAHLTVGDAKGFARGVETRSVFEFRFFFCGGMHTNWSTFSKVTLWAIAALLHRVFNVGWARKFATESC